MTDFATRSGALVSPGSNAELMIMRRRDSFDARVNTLEREMVADLADELGISVIAVLSVWDR